MNNDEILTIAAALTADARVMGWSNPVTGRTIEIHAVVTGGEPLFQLRDLNGPAQIEILPFPLNREGLTAARATAKAMAQADSL